MLLIASVVELWNGWFCLILKKMSWNQNLHSDISFKISDNEQFGSKETRTCLTEFSQQ